jgi:hypothetical protein
MTEPRDIVGDDDRFPVLGEITRVHRRRLLENATGGVVLAASGLFVPAWLEEAAAGEKPVRRVQDGAEQRRRKQRNEHQRNRRDRGDKQKHDRRDERRDGDQEPVLNPPQGFFDNEGLLDIAFIFLNNNSKPIPVTCFSYKWNTLDVIRWEDKTARGEAGIRFDTTVKQASLYFDRRSPQSGNLHIVFATNPFLGFPTIEINSVNRSVAGPKDMDVGARLSLNNGTYKIEVARLPDDSTHKIFTVTYQS